MTGWSEVSACMCGCQKCLHSWTAVSLKLYYYYYTYITVIILFWCPSGGSHFVWFSLKLVPKCVNFGNRYCMFSGSLYCWSHQWWNQLTVCKLLCTKLSLQFTQMTMHGKKRTEATKEATWNKQWCILWVTLMNKNTATLIMLGKYMLLRTRKDVCSQLPTVCTASSACSMWHHEDARAPLGWAKLLMENLSWNCWEHDIRDTFLRVKLRNKWAFMQDLCQTTSIELRQEASYKSVTPVTAGSVGGSRVVNLNKNVKIQLKIIFFTLLVQKFPCFHAARVF